MPKAARVALTKEDKEEIILQSELEYTHSLNYRQKREPSWATVDDLYFARKKKSLISRANIHIPFLQGNIETFVSKIDEPPTVTYAEQEEADRPKAVDLNGLISHDMRVGFWVTKDLAAKRQAAMYGRAIFKKYSTSEDGFTDYFEVVDVLDALIDPMAGGIMPYSNARYCGHDNIIRTKYEMENEDLYDQEEVKKIVGSLKSDSDASNRYQSMQNRRASLGLSEAVLVSDDAAKLTEWYTTWHGQRIYVLFSVKDKVAVRIEYLSDVKKDDEFPFASWAVFEQAFEFWTPGMGELFKDPNQVMNVVVSQVLDNNAYRNYGMTAYDMNKVANPAYLDPKPMGKIPVNGNPKDVLMKVEFPDIMPSLSVLNFINASYDRDSGVNNQAKGMPNSKRMSATEFAGLIDQVADRFFTQNRTYRECFRRIAELYYNGIEENMTTERRVRVLGTNGFKWRQVKPSEVKGDFDIVIATSSAEELKHEQDRENFLKYVAQNRENTRLNQSFLDEKEARVMGFSEDEVQRLLHPEMEGDWEILAEAAGENEDMMRKDVEPNRGATVGHMQKHLDFATKTNGLKPEVVDRIIRHTEAEAEFAIENQKNKAREFVDKMMVKEQAEMLAPGGGMPTAPAPTAPPVAINVNPSPAVGNMGANGPLLPGNPGNLSPEELTRMAAITGAPQPNAAASSIAPLA